MTDTAILDHVHRELLAGRVHQEVIDFIQTEWHKRDEKDRPDLEQITEPDVSTSNGRPVKTWCIDAREMERYRRLEIGPDGTVMEVK